MGRARLATPAGGELPAMIFADCVVRLLPGVLGGETSAEKESFQADDQSIEHPQYTRPEDFRGKKVPDVLLSGHHGEIAKWQTGNSQRFRDGAALCARKGVELQL